VKSAPLDSGNVDIVGRVVQTLERNREATDLVANRLKTVSDEIKRTGSIVSELPRPEPVPARQLEDMTHQLNLTNAKSAEVGQLQLDLVRRLRTLENEHRDLHRAAAKRQVLTTIAIAEHATESVLLQWSTTVGGNYECRVDVHVGKIDKAVHLENLSTTCEPAGLVLPSAPDQLVPRRPYRLKPVPWSVTADVIERRWFGERYAILRFDADPSAMPQIAESSQEK
jgi:hypothetical protein